MVCEWISSSRGTRLSTSFTSIATRVAGTVGLMSMPIMGCDENFQGDVKKVYKAALALGLANQLTNILRDVGEDAQTRNRIYVPIEDLNRFGITEQEVLRGMFSPSTGKVDDRWVAFMKFQIERARQVFKDAEDGVNCLHKDARWPVWSALDVYRNIFRCDRGEWVQQLQSARLRAQG